MLIVALTGGIATGKSIVAEVLGNLGCYVQHADRIAHQLIEPGRPAWKKIVDHFGKDILNENQTINRTRLGEVIFAKRKERHFLNTLLHPLVMETKKEVIRSLREAGQHKIFVSEAALTLEAGFAALYDKIVVVYCPQEVQIKRLMERDGISRQQALKKIRTQMSSEDKAKQADYLIDSSGSLAHTVEQAERVFRNLMLDYELKYGRTRRKS
jgi:dephospho-CoA kinase